MLWKHEGDSLHEVVATLSDGGQIHFFKNRAGVPYMALYSADGFECASLECGRGRDRSVVIARLRQAWVDTWKYGFKGDDHG